MQEGMEATPLKQAPTANRAKLNWELITLMEACELAKDTTVK